MTEPVLFLDIDGVLNSRRYVLAHPDAGVAIDPERMVLLQSIVERTRAQIVLTSSWREHWHPDDSQCDSTGMELNRIFGAFGLEIADKTPDLGIGREQEISYWLAEHPGVCRYAVLDDGFLDGKLLAGRFVKTAYYGNGLEEDHAAQVIALLEDV